jgi:hypothetical protein
VISSSRAPRPVAAASSSLGASSSPACLICPRCCSRPAHIRTASPAACSARPRSITHRSPPTKGGRVRAGARRPDAWPTGAAVRPYKATVATITANVAGRIFGAPPMPLAARPAPNVEAVAAATMPRGGHPPDEGTLIPRQVRPERRCEGCEGPWRQERGRRRDRLSAPAPAKPIPTLTANCPSWLPRPLWVLAMTPWNTSAPRMPPTGSISEPSHTRTRFRNAEFVVCLPTIHVSGFTPDLWPRQIADQLMFAPP